MSITPPTTRVKPSRSKKPTLSYPELDNNNKNVYANILLIDSRVTDFQKIVDSVNSNTLPIVYLTNASKPELMTLLQNNFTSISRIGMVFYSSSQNTLFLDNKSFYLANETTPYSENTQFILDIVNQFNIKNVDYLACNTLNDSNWVNYYNILTTNTGVTIGASNDKTGNIKYGGDWVLESTSQDVELIYFTSSIEYYSYLLDTIEIISSDGSYTITYTITSGTTLAVYDIYNNIYPDNISVTIPYNVTYNAINYTVPVIGNTNGDPVTSYYPESITSLTLSTGLIIVYDYAFFDVYGSTSGQYLILSSLVIPNTVTNLGYSSFINCLTQSPPADLIIPASVNVLGGICFESCIINNLTFLSNTTEVNINNTIQLQDNTPFSYCPINNIILPSGITTYPNILNNIYYNSSTYTIPSSVTTIGYNAFTGWFNVNFIMPDGLINIRDFAFSNVINTTITLPSSLQTIGISAFQSCGIPSNSRIQIPASVTSIGTNAFLNISGLSNVTFLQTPLLPTIGTNAFSNNAVGRKVYYYSTVTNSSVLTSGGTGINSGDLVIMYNYSNVNYIINIDNTATVYGYSGTPTNITIPTSVTFNTVTYNVTSIGDSAFLNCTSLLSVTFLQTPLLPTIGTNAFSSNAVGRKVYYYSTVTNSSVLTTGGTGINSGDLVIMYNYSNVNYIINIDNTATVYGYSGTPTNITIPTSVTFNTVTYNVTSIGDSAFLNCTSLLSLSIPTSVTTIGISAFSGANSLTSITFPISVTSIGDSAFYGATGLSDVTFSQTTLLPTIGTNAFSNNAANREVYCYSTITNLSVLTSGGTGVNFSDLIIINTSSNINFTLDNGTNTATVYTYNGSPTTITIPSSITISSVIYNVISIGNSAFIQCFGLESVIISSSVTSIGTSAFANITTLITVTLPNSLITIGAFAFSSNSSLSSINIPASVTSIGESAFQYCSNLATVTFLQNSGNLPDFVSGSQFNSIANPSTAYYSPGISNPGILGEPGQYFTNIEPSGPIPCFKEGTKILTDKGYTPIQYLRKGTLVKTLKNGYKPIFMIGKKEMYHVASQERIKDQLYKCSKNEYPELFEDLIITGCHSILVNSFKEEQREKIINTLGNICITEGTYRLPACLDDKAIVYETPGKYTIYHFALEHDNYIFNYGVLANGLLVESCSKRYLKEISNMEMIE